MKKDDETMLHLLAKLDAGRQEHFRNVVRAIAQCYADSDNCNALLVLSIDNEILLSSINADTEQMAALAFAAASVLGKAVTEAAPPREQFN